MKFALIPPTRMQDHWLFKQDYHLLLTHELSASIQYAHDRPEGFVILDNGAYEGKEILFRSMHAIAQPLRADVVVVPDTLGDYDATVAQCRDAIAYLDGSEIETISSYSVNLMVVPHGKHIDHWMQCLDELINIASPRVSMVGIPVMYEEVFGTRLDLIWKIREYCRDKGISLPIHLLGWDGDIQKLLTYSAISKDDFAPIRGIDSAKPIYWAYYGYEASNMQRVQPTRPEKYFEFTIGSFTVTGMELLEFNIRLLQAMSLSGHYAPYK